MTDHLVHVDVQFVGEPGVGLGTRELGLVPAKLFEHTVALVRVLAGTATQPT